MSRSDRGAVTAEAALALPALALVAAAIVGLGHVGVAQLRCVDAARAAARLAARGEPEGTVRHRAAAAAPAGAAVRVTAGAEVTVVVTARVPLPFGLSLEVGSRAVADTEDTVPAGGT